MAAARQAAGAPLARHLSPTAMNHQGEGAAEAGASVDVASSARTAQAGRGGRDERAAFSTRLASTGS